MRPIKNNVMAKKTLAAAIIMICCALSVSAQSKVSYLVENPDSIVPYPGTRHYAGYVKSGRIATLDVIMDCKLRGHENEYVVVSKVVGNEITTRTWCHRDKINKVDLLVQSVTSTKENGQDAIAVTFTDGKTWVTEDLRWAQALPGQKVEVTIYDGETYLYKSYRTDGSVDQGVYQLAMK